MSLDKLSTELDANIASHLAGDLQSLSALSKACKYYRSVAEPFLYKDVRFNGNESWHLWCLLRTMIDRDGVALHLKRLSLYDIVSSEHGTMADSADYKRQHDKKMRKEICARSGLIMKHVNNALHPFKQSPAAAELKYEWMGNLFSMRWNESLAALILIFSHEIEAIKLRVEVTQRSQHKLVRGLLTLPWSGTKSPFQKLKVLSIKDTEGSLQLHSSSMLLSLEDLTVQSRWRSDVVTEFSILVSLLPSDSNPALTTLRLCGNNLTPAKLQTIAASPISTNLRRLRLADFPSHDYGNGSTLNFHSLVKVLEKCFPNLEEFHWKGSRPWDACSELANFQNLHKLRSLRLICRALMLEQDQDQVQVQVPRALVEPHRVFPPRLETLVIERIAVEDLNAICDKFQLATGGAEVGDAMILKTLAALLSGFSLKRFELDIWPHERSKLRGKTLMFLRRVADEMFKLGVVMKVYFMPRWWKEHHYTLMVKKGFVARPFRPSQSPSDDTSDQE